jgi:hypothetical protein
MTSIAITISTHQDLHQSLKGSGHIQNAFFLYKVLLKAGFDPFFVYLSNELNWPQDGFLGAYNFINFDTLIEKGVQVDLVLEVVVALEPEKRQRLRQKFGAKIVQVRMGNSYFMDIEKVLFFDDLSVETPFYRGVDHIWVLPHHQKSAQYVETLNGCGSSVMPFLWEPWFVTLEYPAELENQFPLNIYVMEPNLNSIKNSLIPLCIISRLFQDSPDSFGTANLLNTLHIKDKPFFLENIVRNLPGTSGDFDKVFFSGRYDFNDVFSEPAVLIGFQHENSLNYLYNDALYCGIPLVHNSPDLAELGYFYQDIDIETALKQLRLALSEGFSASSRARNRVFLERYSTDNKEVQDTMIGLVNEAIAGH